MPATLVRLCACCGYAAATRGRSAVIVVRWRVIAVRCWQAANLRIRMSGSRRIPYLKSPALPSCAITVQDDPVLALKTGFNVTDTFTISFADSKITAVDTSSNDQPIYYAARDWVLENYPEIMTGPCQGFFAGGATPADCARAMADGYRQYYAAVVEPGEADE